MPSQGTITEEIIRQVRERTDIVQVIGEHVRLIPTGRNFKGLCPFHGEKTPSFIVTPQKQIFHCFGCHKGGDVFKFVMETDQVNFPEAVRRLADRCGVVIPEKRDRESDPQMPLYDLMAAASELYIRALGSNAGKEAREYLTNRGLGPEVATAFGLGFAPNEWDTIASRFGRDDQARKRLEEVGLAVPRKDGNGVYDRFRHRLMIPIHDRSGRVVGFGGRVMTAGEEPKYLNSPETPLFNKRRLLYNLHRALPHIRRADAAIVVEGYLDAISLVAHGVENVVATLGTAITSEQLQLLARNCQTVYFCYDADEAGQRATVRAVGMQRETALVGRIITLSDTPAAGKDDPDSFIRREGREAFLARVQAARDIYSFLIDTRVRALPKPIDIATKDRVVNEFREMVAEVTSPIVRAEIIKALAVALGTDIELLKQTMRPRSVAPQGRSAAGPRPMRDGENEAAEWILRHVLNTPTELARVRARIEPEYFRDPRLRKAFEAICHLQEAHEGRLTVADVVSKLSDPELESRLSELIMSAEDRPEMPLDDCLNDFMQRNLKKIGQILHDKIRTAEQGENIDETLRLTKKLTEIKRLEQALVIHS